MWVEKFWSTDLSGIALKECMDNFTQYTRRSLVSTYCFFPVHLRERSVTQRTNSKQQSLCHERYRSSEYVYKGFSLSYVTKFEKTGIHFKTGVFAAVAVVDAKAPKGP